MRLLFGFLVVTAAFAEVRPMKLKVVLETAMAQNPDVALARLEERKAADAIRAARDPFVPRVIVGSGLAYSSGFPMSIEGSAPSIVEARATASLYNRPQKLLLEKCREQERTTKIGTEERREAVAYRAATLYVEAGRIAEAIKAIEQQIINFERSRANTVVLIEEGRELPLEEKRARLKLAQARQRLQRLQFDREAAETDLALLLGSPRKTASNPSKPSVPSLS